MRLSQALFKTERDVPNDCLLASHRLLVRAGLIHQVSSGIYSLTPLALRAIQRISGIAREEMNRIGGQEVLLPLTQPATLWKQSQRYDKIDAALARWTDRNGQAMVLAMTHEEAITDLVRQFVHSYRQLPLMLFQIQTKFRDEARPRGGLVRLREFTMKDAYSFHANTDDLHDFYLNVMKAYNRFYHRCGVTALCVEADSGMMGGLASHEYMILSDDGEDTLLICQNCGYAANQEVAVQDDGHCPKCRAALQVVRGIEVGNIFKLGTQYSAPMGATFASADGAQRPLVMGCYGIGISRLLACIIEENHDGKGIVFPKEISPYPYHLIRIGADEEVAHLADEIYSRLGSETVLYDDRNVTAGVKFADADLLGLPHRITVSKTSLLGGNVELTDRKSGETTFIALDQLETFYIQAIAAS